MIQWIEGCLTHFMKGTLFSYSYSSNRYTFNR